MNEQERTRYAAKISIIGIICNIILAGMKLAIGLITGMISIVADAVNNFSDAGASVISLVGFKLSSKPEDDEHPFGHARYEYLSGLVVSFLIMLSGIELLKSSVEKLIHHSDTSLSPASFAILIISIIVKLFMSLMYKKAGAKINSMTLITASSDSRNDCITTGAVLIAALVIYFTGLDIDGFMGIAVSLFILWSGIGLIRETMKPLLGSTPDPELIQTIEQKIMSYEGVLGTHDLMVHDYGPGHFFASVHIEVAAERNVLECHEMIDRIELDFLNDMNLHLVVHYDPIVTSDQAVGNIRTYLAKKASDIDPSITIHDLRIVPGEKNTNVIFDCVVPLSCPVSDKEASALLKIALRDKYPDHTAVIKVEHSYVSLG